VGGSAVHHLTRRRTRVLSMFEERPVSSKVPPRTLRPLSHLAERELYSPAYLGGGSPNSSLEMATQTDRSISP
jgi:hypothetical protein